MNGTTAAYGQISVLHRPPLGAITLLRSYPSILHIVHPLLLDPTSSQLQLQLQLLRPLSSTRPSSGRLQDYRASVSRAPTQLTPTMDFSHTPDSQSSAFAPTSSMSGSGSGSGSAGTGAPGDTPPGVPLNAAGKPVRVLACQLCQSRKIKCDRQTPCANCIKVHSCRPYTAWKACRVPPDRC